VLIRRKHQNREKSLYHWFMATFLRIGLDRASRASLSEQIRNSIGQAILERRLKAGARLPSWGDLAAQLGVARGTVRDAYQRLVDDQLVVAAGAAGTFVTDQPPTEPKADKQPDQAPLSDMFPDFSTAPSVFQGGVPALDAFPYKLWSSTMLRAARAAAAAPTSYPDPRGELELRQEIAAYLAVARGLTCAPSQIVVTNGYAGALGLTIHVLGLERQAAWIEEPGFPLTRRALELARMKPVAVRVDAEGLDVDHGVSVAPDAVMAIVTAGQQAPLGVTLSLARRRALLAWAERSGAWIIEDDYLSELQLRGRAAPPFASLDRASRVIYAGSFSKTITPALRLGFLVVPSELAARFGNVAGCLAPAPASGVQRAVAEFMHRGHLLRHLRRMKHLYRARQDLLLMSLQDSASPPSMGLHATGLAVLLRLPDGAKDVEIATQALQFGLAPVPLSPWYMTPEPLRAGLLLYVTNVSEKRIGADCIRLSNLMARFG
jgi:GntR family transcriptional regulator/MocR family aminotransferase